MVMDLFGNLEDWGKVLDTLDSLKQQRLLDEHQVGLARLVRYRDNWRLREKALLCAMEITRASDVLIADVLNLLVDSDTGLWLRVMAAQALGHMVPLRPPQSGSHFDIRKVTQAMADMLTHPEPPVLEEALRDALKRVQAR